MKPNTLSIGAAAALLAGCAWLPQAGPEVDAAFGRSVRVTLGQQVANPQAGRGDARLGEFDAQAARNALGRYRDGFKAPPPTFTIFGIGGSPGGGGGSQ